MHHGRGMEWTLWPILGGEQNLSVTIPCLRLHTEGQIESISAHWKDLKNHTKRLFLENNVLWIKFKQIKPPILVVYAIFS